MANTVKTQTDNKRTKQVLLLGVGYSAKALLPDLKSRGYSITGTCRDGQKAAELSELYGIRMIEFSGQPSAHLRDLFATADIILSSIPPTDDGRDPVLSAFTGNLKSKAEWVGYLSATSVYGGLEIK